MAPLMSRSIAIILLCAAITFVERLLPFLLFSGNKVPEIITYLGKILPVAVLSVLVVYCMRNAVASTVLDFLPQILSVAVTAALHLWKRNSLLSIAGGTSVYMVLIRIIV